MKSKVHNSKLSLGIFRKNNVFKLENEYETITSGAQFRLNTTVFTGYTHPTSHIEAIQPLGQIEFLVNRFSSSHSLFRRN